MLQKLGYIVMGAFLLAYLALCIALSRKRTRDELHQRDLTRRSKEKSLWKPDLSLDELPQASYI